MTTSPAEALKQAPNPDAPEGERAVSEAELAAAEAVPENLPEPRKASAPTHFAFENAVFKVKEALFVISPVTGEPTYNVPLGDFRASLPVDLVAASFGIAKESPDAQLLQIVKRSLRFVKEIRPGDSIPSEILDGTASWSVEARHRELARARVTLQFAWQQEGRTIDAVDLAEMETLANLPDTVKKLREAYPAIADILGYGRDNATDIITKGDELAREWAYIEALRERFGKIQKLFNGFAILRPIYKRERAIQEDIIRIRTLMKKPVEEIAALFDKLDADTGEILITLRKFPSQIRYIRDTRDDFHQRFMMWDGLLAEWKDVPLERSLRVDRLVRVSYRFLAHHFPLDSEWSLQNY